MVQSQTDAPEESDLWTAWQLFPLDDDQTCYSKDSGSAYSNGQWALNYYITQCTGNSISFGDKKSWRNDAVEKTAPSRGLGPWVHVWAAQENGKEMLMAIRVGGVNRLPFCSVSNSLLHTTLSNKVRGIFFLRTVSLVFIIVSSLWLFMHACICIVAYVLCGYTTIFL